MWRLLYPAFFGSLNISVYVDFFLSLVVLVNHFTSVLVPDTYRGWISHGLAAKLLSGAFSDCTLYSLEKQLVYIKFRYQ